MSQIYFHQINVSNLKEEIDLINKLLLDPNNLLLGLEITIQQISSLLDINIDPQHCWESLNQITCVERTKEILPQLSQHIKKSIYVFLLKTDLDSISAAAILDIYLNSQKKKFTAEMLSRINSVANYDRHGRKNNFYSDSFKIPRGLFLFVSGWKNSIESKINTTKKWILTGSFEYMNVYNSIAIQNSQEAIYSSKVEIIIPQKLVFIRSLKRGACGLGYKFAPIVVALNPSYRFGFGESRIYGKKWIIGQLNNNFLDISFLLADLQKLERGWGGSPTIIGSPQDRPSKLGRDEIFEILQDKII